MSPRLTIVGLHFAPEPTGNAPYTTFLAKHLSEAGWTVKVVTGYPHYPQWRIYDGYTGRHRRERAGQADVLRLRHYVPRAPRLLTRLLMEVDFGVKAARVDWGDPDVVLFVSPALLSSAIGALSVPLRYRNARTAVWVQDLYSRGFEESHASASRFAAPMRVLEGAVMSSMDKVVVIHDRFRKHMHERVGLAAHKVDVIPNWSHLSTSPPEDRGAVRERWGWGDDEVVVLHAGNMGVKQGLDNVVETARLAEQQGVNARFVLLGDGNQRRRLQELGTGAARLQFVDPLPDDQYLSTLRAADVLLVNEAPGVREMAVPSKLTSYFLTGRPVLAAVDPASATANEIERSDAGVVVPSGDPGALLDGVGSLVSDPDTALRLGANGPRYAERHLTPAAAVRRWDETLRALTTM
ncbi:glycosyltransferase family 4 protein [Kocuria rosea]|uniref:Glycosyltransferase WbuB n=1 Tax=Kocuria rosea TaxID=1275 RepID=A0A4R5YCJ8_KOCRO|nr:glycosyltransferase family 4 protein [Kocuria rosea]TDL42435.1 glycosyltransferase WbuB [Kocuria rosea]